MASLHFHLLTVKSVRAETDEAVVVAFDVPANLADTFRFSHGQHLTLRSTIDGSDERRSYSICAGAHDGELRVGVRKVPGGRFSTWINEHLRAGDTVQVMAPDGRFFVPLDAGAARHYLGVAGGSGITPILSIMKTVLAAEPQSRFTLLYGNRKLRSSMFLEEIEDLKNRYLSRLTLHLLFSQEATDLPLFSGRLDRAKLAEFFAGGTLVDTGEIDFHAAQGNILDAAAAAGLEVPFSCKSGVCCTCRAKLLEGEVRMDRNFALEKHEVAAGFVLTCQAHPLTERVVLSFDER